MTTERLHLRCRRVVWHRIRVMAKSRYPMAYFQRANASASVELEMWNTLNDSQLWSSSLFSAERS